MIEIYSPKPSPERIDELLDIVLRDKADRSSIPASRPPASRPPDERRYVESIRLCQRSLNSLENRWVPAGKYVDFFNAPAEDLADWLSRTVKTQTQRDAARQHCILARQMMKFHGPYRTFVRGDPNSSGSRLDAGLKMVLDLETPLTSSTTPSTSTIASKSLALLKSAEELDPELSMLHSRMGWWHWFFGDLDRVPDCFAARLRLARTSHTRSSARSALALFCNDAGECAKAERLQLQALEVDGPVPMGLLNAVLWTGLNGKHRLSQRLLTTFVASLEKRRFVLRWSWSTMQQVLAANLEVRGEGPDSRRDFELTLQEALYTNRGQGGGL